MPVHMLYSGRKVRIFWNELLVKWSVRDYDDWRQLLTVVSHVSIKHAVPSDTLDEIVGIVTTVPRFPPGFDCASIVERSGYHFWECRDGRNGELWTGSDIVAFNGRRIVAGSCNLIDVYENSDVARVAK